ncbi:LTA synthase family protein [Prevotella intermedia]|uniref:LTA synthase family protein n=1 Tax=Prevotella intermedia TaxID=28131 RepID=UPI000C24E788|nr:alkaline phosphatase family protein [Prevotella intermedia]PJI21995.1 sulfatase [Prevotella intermedia]
MTASNKKDMPTQHLQPLLSLVANVVLAYLVYLVARVAYLLENYSFFKEGLNFGHLMRMFRGGLMFDTTALVYSNALYILLMLFPLWLKETDAYHRFCRWLFVVVNAIGLFLNLCDAVYFPFTLRRTTTSVFREFDNENNLGSIFTTEVVNHWYFVLLFIVVTWGMYKLYRMPKSNASNFNTPQKKWQFAGINFLSLALAAVICVGGARGGLQSGVRPITISNANEYVKRPIECALVLNTPFALMRTIGKSIFKVPATFASLDASAKFFTPIHTPNAKVKANKKNVVILIVESFGREYIGAYNTQLEGGRYKGYTPNVDKLIKESTVFEYSYANGHKSIDGMPSSLCGIPMFIEPFILTPASMNDYTGIPGHLSKWGYQTAFFHGANRGSMGFLAFANKIGFQKYYGRQDYAQDKRFGGDADFDGNWGIWDEPFLQYYCAKMGEMKQPFMTALFTVSSHHPFVVPDKYNDQFKGGQLPIHKCIRYTDMAIGRFFESARKQPWFKNTIFILVSDHTNQSNHQQYKTDIGEFSAPFILYDPSGEIKPEKRAGIAQQTDIMPTVFGILGYNKPYLSFGCDLLNTPPQQTYALNYINGVYQYTKNGYTMQFDGNRVTGIYSLKDLLMQHNLVDKVPEQAQMERELKAIIYQYMYRMVNNKLR